MKVSVHSPRTLCFGVFEVDLRAAELRKQGVRIRLQEQPFKILAMMLEHSGELVTREELRQELWPAHTFVDFDRNLNRAMNKLRSALGDSAESPRFIETLPRRGYRFIAPINGRGENATGMPDTPHPPTLERDFVAQKPEEGEASSKSAFNPAGLRLFPALGATAAAILICAGLIYLRVVLRGSSNSLSPRRSIAVLGFKNLSGRPDEAWLSTALSDWLTTELSAGDQLRTISAENVARMKNELSLPDVDSLGKNSLLRIRKNLGADLVVVGSYASLGQESGAQIRVDLRLEDTHNGETINAISETGTQSHLFDLVSRAGEHLRARLGIQTVTREEAAEVAIALPSNHDAARLYSEGVAKLHVFDALTARDLFQKAIAIEPGYALAHSALATAWATLGYDEEAKAEAEKAFNLSSNLPRAERLLVEGRYHEMSKDWEKAIEIYRALFEFFPDSLDYGLALASAQVSGGKGKEALATVEALQKLPRPLGDDPRLDLADARAAESLGDFKRDLASTVGAAEKARAVGASLLLAQARADQAWALENLGRLDEAVVAAEEAKQVFAAAGDRRGVALAINNIGISLQNQGDPAGAKRMYEESLAIFRQIGNKLCVADEFDNIGDVLFALGDLPEARAEYEESLATYREIGHQDGVALAKGALGFVLLALGDHNGAKKTCGESLEICRRIGDRSKAGIALACLGGALRADGNLEGARNYEREAASIFEGIGDRSTAAQIELALAELLIDQGNAAKAAVTARRAAEEFERVKASQDESLANAVLGQAFLAQGKITDARKAIERAVALLGKCHNRELELDVAITAARVRAASGSRADRTEAAKSLQEVVKEATRIGFVNYGLDARLALGEIEMNSADSSQGRARLEAVERDAADSGFGLIAQKAASALRTGLSRSE